MVAIPGGEPLIHRDIGEIVKGIVARKKFVSLCTNALLLEKKLHLFEPSPYLFFSVHLDGLKDHHDKSVSLSGVFDIAIAAIKKAKAKGFAVNVNATIFDGHAAEDIAAFLDLAKELEVGVSISPGYAYERAPDQEHFLNRRKTKELFRRVFSLGKGKKWQLMHSSLFLDFLAGNREFHCTPWGMPTRNVFGWQKPCYLLGEGYVGSFKELMETTDWDSYGTGRYEKCANCMAHCGYEPTAANVTMSRPLSAIWTAIRGVRTDGPMAPEIPLDQQRPADFVYSRHVETMLAKVQRKDDSDQSVRSRNLQLWRINRQRSFLARSASQSRMFPFAAKRPQIKVLVVIHAHVHHRSDRRVLHSSRLDGGWRRLADRGRIERLHGKPLPPKLGHQRPALGQTRLA